jgi:hypothetical protein
MKKRIVSGSIALQLHYLGIISIIPAPRSRVFFSGAVRRSRTAPEKGMLGGRGDVPAGRRHDPATPAGGFAAPEPPREMTMMQPYIATNSAV